MYPKRNVNVPPSRTLGFAPLCALATLTIISLLSLFLSAPPFRAVSSASSLSTTSGASADRAAILVLARDAISRLNAVRDSKADSSQLEALDTQIITLILPPSLSGVAMPTTPRAMTAELMAAKEKNVADALIAKDIKATILSIDFHISPIADLKHVLSLGFPGVKVEDRSLSGACVRMQTCASASNLAVLRGDVGHSMHFGEVVRHEFFEAYRSDAQRLVKDADVMICSHPTGMCELIMPFGKPVILWATTRFEQGRERHVVRLNGWIQNFQSLAALPGSAVAANNMYDVHYVHYFTGIMPRYIPSHSGFPNVQWTWTTKSTKKTILVHGFRPFRDIYGSLTPAPPNESEAAAHARKLNAFLNPLRESVAAAHARFDFLPLRAALGDDYKYADLASYPAILHFPYQVSIMSFFEQYRMGIPIIAPSLTLLTRWHAESLFVSERTWDTVLYNKPSKSSVIPRHADADEPFDPNDEENPEAIRWWLQWSDYYVFPHVILFDSWSHLTEILETIDLEAVSAKMKIANANIEEDIMSAWTDILKNIPISSHSETDEIKNMGYEERMNHFYGIGKWADYNW